MGDQKHEGSLKKEPEKTEEEDRSNERRRALPLRARPGSVRSATSTDRNRTGTFGRSGGRPFAGALKGEQS